MNRTNNVALTLMELLVAMVVLFMVMWGIYGIQLFSDYHVVSGSRKSTLQNEATYLLGHMKKQLEKAVANGSRYPVALDGATNTMLIWTDTNSNSNDGKPDGQLQDTAANHDTLVYYQRSATGTVSYCNDTDVTNYLGGAIRCNFQPETIATHLASDFSPTNVTISTFTNYIEINVTARWDPSPLNPASLKNPAVNFHSRLDMPSVSSLQ